MLEPANPFAKVIADTSDHRLPVGTIVAIDRLTRQTDPVTGLVKVIAMVQPGGLAVYVDDLEDFDPLAPTPETPVVVNGRPLERPRDATETLAADPDFAAVMAGLNALFTGAPERLEEPSLAANTATLPEGQEAASPTVSGDAVAAGANTVAPSNSRSMPFNPRTDAMLVTDADGDTMKVIVRARVRNDNGELVVFVVRQTCEHGVAVPVEDEARISTFIVARTEAYQAAYGRMKRDGLL